MSDEILKELQREARVPNRIVADQAFSRAAGAPLIPGNKIRLLRDAAENYPALTIQGSYVGSVPEMTELMELVRRTGLPDVPVATRPLDDVNAVHGELRAGKIVGRVVLTPAA